MCPPAARYPPCRPRSLPQSLLLPHPPLSNRACSSSMTGCATATGHRPRCTTLCQSEQSAVNRSGKGWLDDAHLFRLFLHCWRGGSNVLVDGDFVPHPAASRASLLHYLCVTSQTTARSGLPISSRGLVEPFRGMRPGQLHMRDRTRPATPQVVSP